MSDNQWVELQNGELILFLHQHLPSLQAKTHHEFNALGSFLQLLDKLITNKFAASNGAPFIEIRISKADILEFGSGKQYKDYIDNFFIPESDYFYSGEAYHRPKKHITYFYMRKFILDAQSILISKLGLDNYCKPLKINLTNPIIEKAYSIPFEQSKILDKDLFELFKNKVGVQEAQHKFIDKNAASSVLLTNKQALKYYNHTFNDRQIRTLPLDKTLYTFKVKRISKNKSFKPTLPTAKQLKDNIHTKIKINQASLDKMIKDADGFYINLLQNIKNHYQNNDNYLFYKEVTHRLYATSDINKAPLLQGLTKEIRNKIFSGFYQYDLTASAPTILHQLYQRYCKTQKLNTIEAYISNRDSLREVCANYLLVNDKEHYQDINKAKTDVKEVITAIFYGGEVLNRQSGVSMSHLNREALYNNVAEFKALALEAKEMFDDLYKEILKSINVNGHIKYDKIIINPYTDKLNKKSKKTKRSKASVLSEIYFYHERQILNIAREQFPNIILLVHDGFIIEHIWVDELEAIIEKELGLKIHYEEEVLS